MSERITLLRAGLLRPDGVVITQDDIEAMARQFQPPMRIRYNEQTDPWLWGHPPPPLGTVEHLEVDGDALVAVVRWDPVRPKEWSHIALSFVGNTIGNPHPRVLDVYVTNHPLYPELGIVNRPNDPYYALVDGVNTGGLKSEERQPRSKTPLFFRRPRTALHLLPRAKNE